MQKEFNQLYAYFEPGAEGAKTSLADLLAEATRESADNTTRLVNSVQDLMTQAASAGKAVHQLLEKTDSLAQLASTDSLTHALNREGFTTQAREILGRANRYGFGYALAYIDMDGFKKLNDSSGHGHGDKALQHAVRAMLENIRKGDLIGRLGGDEFVMFFPEIDEATASAIASKIVTAAATPAPERPKNAPPPPTLSVGLLFVPPRTPALPLETLLAMADGLMYQSKRAGGNRLTQGTPQTAPAARSA